MSYRAGRTRWKRFAALLVPGVMATAALGVGMAQGALAVSFFVSGHEFQLAADTLDARGLSIYGMVDVARKGTLIPVVVTGARRASITGLCQSVVMQIPVLGPYTLTFTGGERRPIETTNLFIDATTELAGQANFKDLDIGVAAGALTKGPVDPGDRNSRFFDPDGFAQQAASASLTNVRVHAVAVSATTFNVPGLAARVRQGAHDCF